MKRRFPRSLAALYCALAICVAIPAHSAATLVSDKDDYAPGEIAILTGAGFNSGELIDLSISIDDPLTGMHIADYTWVQFNANSDGGFVAVYEVPVEAADMTLVATAMGLESGLVATVTFTDTVSSVTLNSPTTAEPVVVTVDGGTVAANISYVTTETGPADANVHFEIVGVATFAFNGEPRGEQLNKSYDLILPLGTPNGYYSLKVTVIHQGNLSATWLNAVLVNVQSEPPDCPENFAPTLTASDLDLGQIVGCLVNGSFEHTAQIALSDFDYTASDPDGDPVEVTLNVSGVTLVGPGLAEVTVDLTATDNPSSRNVDGCDPLEPMSTTVPVSVKAQIVFGFDGFRPPLSNSKTTTVKNGSAVPVKFRLLDCDGNEICDELSEEQHIVAVAFSQGAAPNGDPEIDDAGSSGDNGNAFRYSGACGGGGNWIFNLKTGAGLGYVAGNTYKITATLNDGTTHEVCISIK